MKIVHPTGTTIFDELGLKASFVIQPIFAINPMWRLSDESPPLLQLAGGEVLLRLNLNEPKQGVFRHRGSAQLARFFSSVERMGRLSEVDLYVVEKTLLMIKERYQQLNLSNHNPLQLSVNITPQTLRDKTAFNSLIKLLKNHHFYTNNLRLELVESYDLYDMDYVVKRLRELRELGTDIAFDDFGAGFMTVDKLEQAVEAGASYIKIDYLLTSKINQNPKNAAYVERVLRRSKQMSLGVLAEGVESGSIYSKVANMGFDFAQGRWLSKELPVGAFFHLTFKRAMAAINWDAFTHPKGGLCTTEVLIDEW